MCCSGRVCAVRLGSVLLGAGCVLLGAGCVLLGAVCVLLGAGCVLLGVGYVQECTLHLIMSPCPHFPRL